VARIIDADPSREGLHRARENCVRWYKASSAPAIAEWIQILQKDWKDVRVILLDESDTGQRLRQSNPFCGILSPQARWEIYRRFNHE